MKQEGVWVDKFCMNLKTLKNALLLVLLASGLLMAEGLSYKRSMVVRVWSPRIWSAGGINRRVLRDMIKNGIVELAGGGTLKSVLHQIFSKKDIIGFKFNSYNSNILQTNRAVAEEILRLFCSAGYDPAKMRFIGVEPESDTLPKVPAIRHGWSKEVNFVSGKDKFASVLNEVTAIVNVGTLMADAISEINGCMRNVTLGFVKRPALYYKNKCVPYMVDIYSLPAIRKKIRFNILCAIRILVKTEQYQDADSMAKFASLLFSRDIVALDATGFEILEKIRNKRHLPSLVEGKDYPSYILLSAKRGIGVYHPDQINLRTITVR